MPGLRNKAVLEIDVQDQNGSTRTGVFVLQEDLQQSGSVSKRFLLSNRGQYIREAVDIGTEILSDELNDTDFEDRRGYHVDGGAGTYAQSLAAKAGDRDVQWGDGSTDPDDPSDVTKYDATGADPIAQKQILEWYISQSGTDSRGQCRLYIGEWADGTHAQLAGAFGKPLVLAIIESNVGLDPDDPSALDVTIEGEWTAVLPDAAVAEAESLVENISEIIPDR